MKTEAASNAHASGEASARQTAPPNSVRALSSEVEDLSAMAAALAQEIQAEYTAIGQEAECDTTLYDRVAPLSTYVPFFASKKDLPSGEARRTLGMARRRIRLEREGEVLREQTQELRQRLAALAQSSERLVAHSRRIRQAFMPQRATPLDGSRAHSAQADVQRRLQELEAVRRQHREALRAWSEQAAEQRERAIAWARQVARYRRRVAPE